MGNDDMRERIVGSLRALMKEKPLAKITVGDISAATGVSRQTFYYHFDNVFDIFRWTIESQVRYKRARVRESPCFLTAFREWLLVFERERDLTLAFFRSSHEMEIHRWLRNELTPVARETLVERIGADLPPERIAVCASFLVNANLGILSDWVDASMEGPADEVIGPVRDLLLFALDPKIAAKLDGTANCLSGNP